MRLYNKVRAVTAVLKGANREVDRLKNKTGLQCIERCHECCAKENIQATSLEFYPLAYHLYKTNQAYVYLEEADKLRQIGNSKCILYKPALHNMQFGCAEYEFRGLICRLFGYTYSRNKYDLPVFSSCRHLKNTVNTKGIEMSSITPKPEMGEHYRKLLKIDFYLANRYMPINDAITKAIEDILFHFELRGKRTG